MQGFRFDDRAVTWQRVEYLGAEVYVTALDEGRGIADVLIRFQPNTPGKLHRHVCDFTTFVVQGELRFCHEPGRGGRSSARRCRQSACATWPRRSGR